MTTSENFSDQQAQSLVKLLGEYVAAYRTEGIDGSTTIAEAVGDLIDSLPRVDGIWAGNMIPASVRVELAANALLRNHLSYS